MTVSTTDISVLNTLQRLYTLLTSRVKVQKNFGPNHAMLIKHNTTLPRCGCIGTLQGLYKDSLVRSSPLRFPEQQQSINLPDEHSVLEKPTSQEEQVIPCQPPPLLHFLLDRFKLESLINQPRLEPCGSCGSTFFLGGFLCSN